MHLTVVFSITDIDECTEDSHRCEQICHNSVGSYACSCNAGYRLSQDGVTCDGTVKFNSTLIDVSALTPLCIHVYRY